MTDIQKYQLWESALKWALEQGMSEAEAIIYAEETTQAAERTSSHSNE